MGHYIFRVEPALGLGGGRRQLGGLALAALQQQNGLLVFQLPKIEMVLQHLG